MSWLPDGEKIEMFNRFDRMYECVRQTDGQTDRRTPHDDIGRAYASHRAAKSGDDDLQFVLGEVHSGVFAVDDDVLDERFFERDAVRKLFAHQPGDGRQEEQWTEDEDAEADRCQEGVEKLEPAVLLLRFALHILRDPVAKTAEIDETRETATVVSHPLVTHPALVVRRHLYIARHSTVY